MCNVMRIRTQFGPVITENGNHQQVGSTPQPYR